jgi:hypothetical protein
MCDALPFLDLFSCETRQGGLERLLVGVFAEVCFSPDFWLIRYRVGDADGSARKICLHVGEALPFAFAKSYSSQLILS